MHSIRPNHGIMCVWVLCVSLAVGCQQGSGPDPGLDPVCNKGPLTNVAGITAGDLHTCAVRDSGAVMCWGANDLYQLGDGTDVSRSQPKPVVGLSQDVAQIGAGGAHTCAVLRSGAVKCWGGQNTFNELGDLTQSKPTKPIDVVGVSSGAVAVAAGIDHSCALLGSGGVKCWGNNASGQLGNGTAGQPQNASDVVGLEAPVRSVTAGGYHTCALLETGAVQCWGSNSFGQLGDGTTVVHASPMVVKGLTSGVVAVAAGEKHTCAVLDSGKAFCWGDNSAGQLGFFTVETCWNYYGCTLAPQEVLGLSSAAVGITAGYLHTCALLDDDRAYCWGRNAEGQLGREGADNRQPSHVWDLYSSLRSVVAGAGHSCALLEDGTASCWGHNAFGQLGHITECAGWAPGPVCSETEGSGTGGTGGTGGTVDGFAVVRTFDAGSDQTCAVVAGGSLRCFGHNQFGQLGDGTTIDRDRPYAVPGLASGVTGVGAGYGHTCALLGSGAVRCWGWNAYGQVGDGSTTDRSTPTTVSGLSSGAVALSVGGAHACAIVDSGAVRCWGFNSDGTLGNGTTIDATESVQVSALVSAAQSVSAGGGHTCVVLDTGALYCFGGNRFGQLGDGTTDSRSTPTPVVGMGQGVKAVFAGDGHTCAVLASGEGKCWGSNTFGQLGNGGVGTALEPVTVAGLASGVTAFAIGSYHTCALLDTGAVQCWGENQDCQLGDGTRSPHLAPATVKALTSGVIAIDAGNSHVCALLSSGELYCWGFGGWGQLGDGNLGTHAMPTLVGR